MTNKINWFTCAPPLDSHAYIIVHQAHQSHCSCSPNDSRHNNPEQDDEGEPLVEGCLNPFLNIEFGKPSPRSLCIS